MHTHIISCPYVQNSKEYIKIKCVCTNIAIIKLNTSFYILYIDLTEFVLLYIDQYTRKHTRMNDNVEFDRVYAYICETKQQNNISMMNMNMKNEIKITKIWSQACNSNKKICIKKRCNDQQKKRIKYV